MTPTTTREKFKRTAPYANGTAAAAICGIVVHPVFWAAAIPFAAKAALEWFKEDQKEDQKPHTAS